MVGWKSKTALGIPTSLAWTIRTKSFSKAVLPSDSVAEALLINGSASTAVDVVPMDTAMGCDGDWIPLINEPSGMLTSTVILMPPLFFRFGHWRTS